MALRIISPTPPLEPASSSSTDSKYFNRERPAPALGGREGEGGGERGGEREGGREMGRGRGTGREGEERDHTKLLCHTTIHVQYLQFGGGIPGCPPVLIPPMQLIFVPIKV